MKNSFLSGWISLCVLGLMTACSSPQKVTPVQFTLDEKQLPPYEKEIDHKALLQASDTKNASIGRGEHIYGTICFSCHGDPDQKGSIPNAFRFWSDSFKVGNDPYSIYQTLTRGYNSMPPQTMLTPREKYDVINFIRHRFVKKHNEAQYFKVDSAYLATLPAGSSQGPEPKEYKPWAEMDYGNFLINTYELADSSAPPRKISKGPNAPLPDEDYRSLNFAYKGIAVRLDEGKGGVAAGHAWLAFDHDLMRVAGAWTGDGFIDWQGILLNGRHNISPRTIGKLWFANPVAPGWADPQTGSFADPRFMARDKRRFGPLPASWTQYKGLYQYKDRVVVSYTVGQASVLETFGLEQLKNKPVFTRTMNISPSPVALQMRVAPAGNAVALQGNGGRLKQQGGFHMLEVPASKALQIKLFISDIAGNELTTYATTSPAPEKLDSLTKGGPARYAQPSITQVTHKEQEGSFQVDILTPPFGSPWKSQLRLSGLDFFNDQNKAAVCTTDGDIWVVEGLLNNSNTITWRRIAAGLFQPLGIRIVNDELYVTCRDQLVKLHDLNGDGEMDFYECFNNDQQVTDHFHEFAMGLQTDAEGNFYYAKSARHAREALVPQHGTLIKVSKDGKQTDIIAKGFRAANGVCINPDGSFIVTDQEGHWNPMNRINWVLPGNRFYGNMFGYQPPADSSNSNMEQPIVWLERKHDQSPSELLWVNSKNWGPLNGSLLNFSYGYGKIFVVPFEQVGSVKQGGVYELPIGRFSTGIMRGRFNPADGALYACGLSAWGSTQTLQLGGLFRIRYIDNGKSIVPLGLHARKSAMEITFSHPLDKAAAEKISSYKVQTWDLLRSRKYGSDHYNEKSLPVTRAVLSEDKKTVMLYINNLQPTWVMEISFALKGANGEKVEGVLQNTIHQLGADK
jgi:hypothetical protein